MTSFCVRLCSALTMVFATASVAVVQDSRSAWIDPARTRVIEQPQAGAANEAGDDFGSALAVGDFDGDGRDDLVVGAQYEDQGATADAGAVFVFPGTPDGPGAGFFLFVSNATDHGAAVTAGMLDVFGYSIATGDFDGDGFDDLVAGAPERGRVGAVVVWPGSASGLDVAAGQLFQSDDLGCGAPETDDFFGDSLAAGDFDADGFDDLAIGAPGEDASAGQVCVVRGGANGIEDAKGASYLQSANGYLSEASEPGDRFGSALAVGHFSDGPNDDLAIGSPGEALSAAPAGGMVSVLFGKSGGVVADLFSGGVNRTEDDAFGSNGIALGDEFGWELAAGDVDQDGLDELAVGSLGESAGDGVGALFVFSGLGGGIAFGVRRDETSLGYPIPETPETYDYFGFAVAFADLDGNGTGDLLVGAPGEGDNNTQFPLDQFGLFALFPSAQDSGAGLWWMQEDIGSGATSAVGDRFGAAIASGDFDGDGRLEVAIGAPGDEAGSVSTGRVYVVPEPGAAAVAAAALAALAAMWLRRTPD